MEQGTNRFYPSAPLEKHDLEQGLEMKIKDVKSFNNHINNFKELIPYFKNKKHKSKKKYKKYKSLNTSIESVDRIVNIGATSASITLSITGKGLNIIPITDGRACVLSLSNKVLHKLIINNYNKYKKLYEWDQLNIITSDKLYRNFLEDNIIDKKEYESYLMFSPSILMKQRTNLFCRHEHKIKIEFF